MEILAERYLKVIYNRSQSILPLLTDHIEYISPIYTDENGFCRVLSFLLDPTDILNHLPPHKTSMLSFYNRERNV